MDTIRKWITSNPQILFVVALLIVIIAGLVIYARGDEDGQLETEPGEALEQTRPEAEQQGAVVEGATVEAEETPPPGDEAVAAAEPTEEQAQETPAAEMTAEARKEAWVVIPEANIRAGDLIGREVEDAFGAEIGQVEDLLIGLQSNQTKYAVAAASDMGTTRTHLIPMPLQTLHVSTLTNTSAVTEPLIFGGPVVLLVRAPDLDLDGEINLGRPDWDEGIRGYWESLLLSPSLSITDAIQSLFTALTTDTITIEEVSTSEAAETDFTVTMPEQRQREPVTSTQEAIFTEEAVVQAVQYIGRNIVNREDQAEGQIVDLLIGQTEGRVNYAVIALAGQADELVIVPYYTLDLPPAGETSPEEAVMLNIEPEVLQNAPSFPANEWPNTLEPGWDEDIFTYWRES